MKAVICFLGIVGVVIAQSEKPIPLQAARSPPVNQHHPHPADQGAYIVRFANEYNAPDYKYGYETSNGIRFDEQGTLTNAGTENEAMEVVGGYEYTDAFNRKVTVTYTAGILGFIPIITYS